MRRTAAVVGFEARVAEVLGRLAAAAARAAMRDDRAVLGQRVDRLLDVVEELVLRCRALALSRDTESYRGLESRALSWATYGR